MLGGLGVIECILGEREVEVGELGVDSESIEGALQGEGRRGTVFPSRRRSFTSSRSLSCNRRLLARFATLWNGKGGLKRRSVR